VVTMGAVYLLSTVTTMSVFVTSTVSMFGIALAIDYSLFILMRFREELRAGRDPDRAADAAMAPAARQMLVGVPWTREQLEALPGLSLHDLMQLPIDRLRRFFDGMSLPSTLLDEALKLLLDEIRTRLRYLCDVGIGYLTLDRQSRTLSGGEVQRINLTTALGTSLVNTMFVLDEPSIGLHPRDMGRIVEAMHRLRDAGNTLVVVEHDPAVMLAADRLIDMRQSCLNNNRMAEMSVPAWPMPIHQTKLMMSNAQPTGTLLPQM